MNKDGKGGDLRKLLGTGEEDELSSDMEQKEAVALLMRVQVGLHVQSALAAADSYLCQPF